MVQHRRLVIAAILVLIPVVLNVRSQQSPSAQSLPPPNAAAPFKGNQCVNCHGNLHEPLNVSTRFFEWQFSKHRSKNVTCEACHGGNPAAAQPALAHAGVLPVNDPQSRLFYKNQPETCGSCHQNIVNTFVQSKHYQALKGIGIGPSCNTCHAHMATEVIYSRTAVADVCSRCHDTLNLMPARPEIPLYASNTLEAINRANAVMQWTEMLLATGQQRGMNLQAERVSLLKSQQSLQRAKLEWHKFDLKGLRPQIDEAFSQAVKVRDLVQKKVN